MFIAEKGPECFASKKEAIQECLNSTFLGYISTETLSLATLPKLVIGEKECADVDALEHCIAKELKTCAETTPLNLVESLFKYIRTESPCANFTAKPVQKTKTVKVESNFGQTNRFSVEVLVTTFLIVMIFELNNRF